MPFVKGNVPGRPVGAEGKELKKIREMLTKVTDDNAKGFSDAMTELRTLQPAKYVEMYLKLLEYSTPKLRSVEAKVDVGSSTLEKIVVELVTKDGNNNKGN